MAGTSFEGSDWENEMRAKNRTQHLSRLSFSTWQTRPREEICESRLDLESGSTTDSQISEKNDNGPNVSHLTCDYPGCKKAEKVFKRIYDLDRHKVTIHNPLWKILCPVTGCPRAKKKPFTRLDKFRVHLKEHGDSCNLTCPVVDCGSSPIAKSDFSKHAGQHDVLERCQMKAVLQALKIPLQTGPWSCPLTCTFQCYSHDEWRNHLDTHDQCERWKFVNSINYVPSVSGDFWSDYRGVASCPICNKVVCGKNGYVDGFVDHLEDSHSIADRYEHRIILAVILAHVLCKTRTTLGICWHVLFPRNCGPSVLGEVCDVIQILSEDLRRSLGVNPSVFPGLEEYSKNWDSPITSGFDLKRLEAQIKAVKSGDAELSTLKTSSLLSLQRDDSLQSVSTSHSSYTESLLQSPLTELAPGNIADISQDMQMEGFAGDMGNADQFDFGINDDILASFNQQSEENYDLLALPMDHEYGCHDAGPSQEIYANGSSSFTSIENHDLTNMQWDWEQSTNLDVSAERNLQ